MQRILMIQPKFITNQTYLQNSSNMQKQIKKNTEAILGQTSVIERAAEEANEYKCPEPPNVPTINGHTPTIAASPYAMNTPASSGKGRKKTYTMEENVPNLSEEEVPLMTVKIETRSKEQLRKDIRETQRKMQQAAKEMDFLAAAKYRDEIRAMQEALNDARGE